MQTSEQGLAFIAANEGLRLQTYLDTAGHPTIGVGHLITLVEKQSGAFDAGISQQQAMEMLRHDIVRTETAVAPLVRVPLSQGQWDAIIDFAFNLGSGALAHSTLLVKLNAGDYATARAELVKWCYVRNPATGQPVVSQGLLGRRQREAALWGV